MPKITFGKSEPFSQGWRGWSDCVDVLVDGKHIGQLRAQDVSNKRWMEYRLECPGLPAAVQHYSPAGFFGLRIAKIACISAINKTLET